jgi:hypothetical protein
LQFRCAGFLGRRWQRSFPAAVGEFFSFGFAAVAGGGRDFMSTKMSALKRAVKSAKAAMGPQRHGVHGKPFVCACCGHDRFEVGMIPVLGLHTLICADCCHVEFFGNQPPVL